MVKIIFEVMNCHNIPEDRVPNNNEIIKLILIFRYFLSFILTVYISINIILILTDDRKVEKLIRSK